MPCTNHRSLQEVEAHRRGLHLFGFHLFAISLSWIDRATSFLPTTRILYFKLHPALSEGSVEPEHSKEMVSL